MRTRSARSTRSTGHRRCCPRLRSSSRPTRRSASRRGSRACARTGRTSTHTSRSSTRARASGRTAARIVAERTIDQLRRLAGDRRSTRPCPGDVEGRERRGPRARPGGRPGCRLSRGPPLPRGAARATTSRRRASSPGLVSAPDGEAPLPALDPALDDARPGPARRPPGGPRRARRRSTRSGGRSPRGAGFGDDVAAYRRSLMTDPANHAADGRGAAGARAPRTSTGRAPSRRRCSAACRVATCERQARRAVQGEGRAVRLLLPADARRHAARHLLHQHRTTCRAGRSASSPRRRYHEAIPGHHFQISLEMEHPALDVFRRLGDRAVDRRLCRGLGPVRGAAGRRARPVPQRRRSGSGCSTHRRGARRGSIVDSGLHGLGWSRQQSIDWLLDDGPLADGRGDRDRPLHRVARAGAHLHDRDARDPAAPPASSRPATATGSTSRAFHDELHRPRLAAARDAHHGAAALGPPAA